MNVINPIPDWDKRGFDIAADFVKNIGNAGTPNSYDSRIPAWIKGLGTMLKKNPKMANIVFVAAVGVSGALVLTGFVIGRKTIKIDLDKLSDKEISEIARKIADAIDEQNKSTDHHEDGDQKE